MDDQLKSNLTSKKHWSRLVYMVLFALCVYVAAFVVAVLIVVQFLFALVTGTDNRKLRQMGNGVAHYIHQCLLFLTYSSEQKPFPFSDWPEADPLGAEEPVVRSEEAVVANQDLRGNDRTPPGAGGQAAGVEVGVPSTAGAAPGSEAVSETVPPNSPTEPSERDVHQASSKDPNTLATPAQEEPRKD